ncbi:MAG: PD40 domain-containing protein, partial [Anaerolineae bacterium]|nr:PD40 domain-containing protein [Anaerolineae bacterium]
AINNLVGVVGSGEIDYTAIANAAKVQLSVPSPAERRPAPAGNNGSGLSTGQIRALLGVAAIVLGLLLAISFVLPSLSPAETATPTLLPTQPEVTQEITEEVFVTAGPPTETPLPGVIVTRGTRPPLPTNTPTLTNTPTITPTATVTLPPIDAYTYLFTGNDGNLYRVDALDGPRPVTQRIADFDVRGGTLAYVAGGSASSDPESTAEAQPVSQSTSQIYFAPLDNPSNALQVTRLETGSAINPAVSPDGASLVYASNEDGDYELYVVELQTGITRQLTNNDGDDLEPHWSPDGTQIVYASDLGSPESFDLYIVNVADSQVTKLVDTANSSRQPRWSPDGTSIVFVTERDRSQELYVVEVGGIQAVRQITFDGARRSSPDWTPDSRYIIHISDQNSEELSLVIISADGQRQEVIATGSLTPREVIVQP